VEPIFEIKEEKHTNNYGMFVISPLEAGYGNTLGVALRRVLLTSLKGAAITKVKINGVKHQFSSLKGMKEDVLEFVLNLKQVRLSYKGEKPVKITLSANKAGEVKAGDLKVPADVKVANPDLVLANLSKGAKLEAEMEVANGRGFSPFEEREKGGVGTIPLDATFSPIVRVNYKVEETRVGRVTNYDKLTLEVWTDGTMLPKDALTTGAHTLISYFGQIVNPKATKVVESQMPKDNLGVTGKLSVEEISLPTRVSNALIKAGFDTVEKLVTAKKEDIVKVRNLGEKSLKVIRVALAEKGVNFDNE